MCTKMSATVAVVFAFVTLYYNHTRGIYSYLRFAIERSSIDRLISGAKRLDPFRRRKTVLASCVFCVRTLHAACPNHMQERTCGHAKKNTRTLYSILAKPRNSSASCLEKEKRYLLCRIIKVKRNRANAQATPVSAQVITIYTCYLKYTM